MENGYFAYIRKSTDVEDKQELSLGAQKNLITECAIKEGIKISRWFEESQSAKYPGRQIFNDMITRFKNGEAKGLIAHKPDRLSRNWTDVGQICDVWDTGLDLLFVTGRIQNNSQGKAMFGMQCLMAKWYVDNLSEETKKGQKESIRIGFSPGQPPLGYLTKMEYLKLTGEEATRREIDNFRAPIIIKAFQLYDKGCMSIEDIVEWAYKEGFRSKATKRKPSSKVNKGAWHNILTNPFYYGYFQWNGQLYKGTHKPLIDYFLWERVRQRLQSNGHVFQRKYLYAFKSNKMRCGECGRGITAEQKFQLICPVCKVKFHYPNKRNCPSCKTLIKDMENPKYLHHVYYCCTSKRKNCTQRSISHKLLEEQIGTALQKIQIDEETLELFKNELKDGLKKEQEFRSVSIQNLNQALGIIQKKHDNLAELYIGGKISEELYNKKNFEYENEINSLEKRISEHKNADKNWYKTALLYLELSRQAYKLFIQASDKLKSKLIGYVFQNLILKDKKLTYTFQKPFDILTIQQERTLMLPREDSNL